MVASKSEDKKDEAEEPARTGELHNQSLSDLKAAQGPLQPTVVDGQGIERIVGPGVDTSWEPAQVSPTEEQIAHHETVLAAEEKRQQERFGALAPSSDDNSEDDKGKK